MRRCEAVLAAAALLALAPAARAADPAPVVAAERAFAADGLAMGIKGSFLKHSTPDAIVFAPDPVKAHDLYGARPDKPHPPLAWWPLWAGIANSGDLGFTTGPATFGGEPSGWYFTVWKRQADGGWKWVYDGGAASSAEGAGPPGSTVAYLAPAAAGAGSPAKAMAEVGAAEAELAQVARRDARAAYLAVLASDARVAGSPAPPATTPAQVEAELATRPPSIEFAPLGGGASEAGDLAWTYGEGRWTEAGQPRRGHYVRIWQARRDGWRLVFDELLPVPPPKSAS